MNGAKKGRIAHKKFLLWLKKRNYRILGRELKTSVVSGGWPDFIVEKNKKIEFFEIKSGKHPVDHHQVEVLKLLRKVGKVRIMRLDEKMKRFSDETAESLSVKNEQKRPN